jgi:hypothetical protein
MDTQSFWSLLGEFGPGFITWQNHVDYCSRPLSPKVDRIRGELGCVIERDWLPVHATHENILCNFVDEFGRRALSIQGRGLKSAAEEDVEFFWGSMQEAWYGAKSDRVDIIALRIIPRTAQLWDLAGRLPAHRWRFDAGEIGTLPVNAHRT